MKKWLDKYSDGGELNYNNSQISLPEEYIGEGYNTKGRNYSPAWGGSFKNGGEITNKFRIGDVIAEDGIELTKLDQLENWTNYNTPQKGGWLQKYNI